MKRTTKPKSRKPARKRLWISRDKYDKYAECYFHVWSRKPKIDQYGFYGGSEHHVTSVTFRAFHGPIPAPGECWEIEGLEIVRRDA
jgi:hypothetical protein